MSNYHNDSNIFVKDVVLKVENLNRSIEFYKSIMGLKVIKEMEKEAILSADGVHPIVTLIQPENIIPKIPRRTGLYHIAILLPNRIQLGLFLKNIRDKRYPIVGGSHHGVSEAVYLEDPDDNGIEVYVDTPESTWDINNDEINMVTEMLDYEDLMESTGNQSWSGAPKDTIIGHIHLHVADLDESNKFYNALGFDLKLSMKNSAYFLSTGGYHHHIGLNVWNGKGAAPLPENSVGMKYYTLLFSAEATRAEKIKNIEDLGYSVSEIDNELFTKDPSENVIKLII